MRDRVYVVTSVVTDHQVREVKQVFAEHSDAVEFCEAQVEQGYKDVAESDATHQVGDYKWSNGVDTWGLEIERATFVRGEASESE